MTKKEANEFLSSSPLGQNNSYSTEISDNIFIDLQHNGFVIIDKENLEVVLNSMRLFLMSLDVTEAYKNCDGKLKEQFSTMIKSVDNALWRLQFVNNDPPLAAKKNYSSFQWIDFYTSVNQDSAQKLSSDEERNSTHVVKRKMHRRKIKKRSSRVLTRSSDDNDEGSENNIYNPMTESFTENSENRIKSFEKIESILSKVLMKPESLVALCLVKKDFKSVEEIIKVRK